VIVGTQAAEVAVVVTRSQARNDPPELHSRLPAGIRPKYGANALTVRWTCKRNLSHGSTCKRCRGKLVGVMAQIECLRGLESHSFEDDTLRVLAERRAARRGGYINGDLPRREN
jgi:hypothetical protein